MLYSKHLYFNYNMIYYTISTIIYIYWITNNILKCWNSIQYLIVGKLKIYPFNKVGAEEIIFNKVGAEEIILNKVAEEINEQFAGYEKGKG